MIYRTHLCGTLSEADCGQEIKIAGWVDVRRDLGGVIFIELRDHSGKVQLVSDPLTTSPEIHQSFESLKPEFCLSVTGLVQKRPTGTQNQDLRTGAVEIVAQSVTILNSSAPLPLPLKQFGEADESFRLANRCLDLRRPEQQKVFRLRHEIAQTVREFLTQDGHLEIETPYLTRSTPEGARDYLVPSRVQAGHFFALPQSPQLFKQMLMASGFPRYFQIVRCFRDEDLRADRQPEFTQIDIEQSFCGAEEVMSTTETLLQRVFALVGRELKTPFPRLSYQQAISRYGCDKPDTRFGLELCDFTELMDSCRFEAFSKVVSEGGVVKGICVPSFAEKSRKEFDELRDLVCTPEYGAKGLAWISYKEQENLGVSPIAKFFTKEELALIKEIASAETGSALFFVADKPNRVNHVLSKLRLHLGNQLGLIDPHKDSLLWVTDWPLVEKNEESGELTFLHHPFTAIKDSDRALLDSKPEQATALAYDVVYNGVELGGGSIRNHRLADQLKALELIGVSEAEAREKFGFLLDALSFGAPPHGGIALGLDRLVMLLAGASSLREVIAFPKVQSSTCPLTQAPASVHEDQLAELSIRLRPASN